MQQTITIQNFMKQSLLAQRTRLFFTLLTFFIMSQVILHAQITYSFTTAGAAGRFGPTQGQLNTAYASTNLNGLVVSSTGIQSWTVPATGLYKVEAAGASGGSQGTQPFGTGATLSGELNLTAGDVINIIVGQKGIDNNPSSTWEGAGGGGGSFVVKSVGNIPIVVAAGGSGGDGYGNYASRPKPGGSSATGNANTVGIANNPLASSAGGGFTFNGQNGNNSTGGASYLNGGVGGICGYGSAFAHGGFGGGGAGDYYTMGGAGAGYQGGSTQGGYNNTDGLTSAYSYNVGANQVNTSGITTSSAALKLDGYVRITYLYRVAISQTSTILCNGLSTAALSTTVTNGVAPFSYSWSPSGGTGATASGLAAGIYTCTVTDLNSAVTKSSFTITQPAALTASISSQTSVSCNGGSNGALTVAAAGQSAPYSYTWSPSGGNTLTASGLVAGNYTVSIKDVNNCATITQTATILQPSALLTSTALTNVSCNGGTGSGTITASGGTSPYTYLWTTASTSSVITVLAGVYTATVSDANNCKSSKSINITQPSALVTSTSVTNVLCNGGTGTGTMTVSGGTGAYTYLWSNAATSSVVTVLAGAYSATVTDVNNCTSSISIIITQPSALVTSTTVINVACNGGNGSGTIAATGGTGAYTYSWSNTATSSSVSVLAGVYTATVSDANNCKSSKSITVTQPSALITTTAVTNVLCNGGNGNGTITASGGTGAYTYLWSNAATNSFVTGVLAGAYTATVTDANNCTSNKSIIITQPSALVTSTAVANVLCNGGNGSATITASGGTGVYTYSWSNTASTSVVATFTAGVYSATVTDANNCVSTKSITITQPTALLSSTAVANVACNGGNGSATITASAGTAPYTYSWSSSSTTSVVSILAGVYTATVTDANGCKSTKSISITQPAALVTSTLGINALCFGGTGSGTITASGGTGTYTYLWSNASTSSVVVGVLSGAYTATVTDGNNCTSTKSLGITQPLQLLLSVSSQTNVTCNSGNNGSAIVTPTGGTGPYTYTWTPSVGNTSTISGLSAGLYSVTVKDFNNCATVQQTVTITQPATFSVSASASSLIVCYGTSVTLNGSGATTYAWTGGITNGSPFTPSLTTTYSVTGTNSVACISANVATISITVNSLPTVTVNSGSVCSGHTFTMVPSGAATYSYSSGSNTVLPVTNTNYSVTGTNSLGCVSANTAVSSVTVNALPTVIISGTNAICSGDSTALSVSGASVYLWNTSSTLTGIVVKPLSTTVYSVVGTNASGCVNSASQTVTVNALPLIHVVNTRSVMCKGESTSLIVNGGLTYSWSTNQTDSSIVVQPTSTTSYTVMAYFSNGCMSSAIATQSVSDCTGLSILKENNKSLITIYPNPNAGNFTITCDENIQVSIVNDLGQVVQTLSLNETNNKNVSISNLANGIYFVVGSNNSQVISQKIIVAK